MLDHDIKIQTINVVSKPTNHCNHKFSSPHCQTFNSVSEMGIQFIISTLDQINQIP
jgi:hypothetical protein